jgi:hypothetical protein
LSGAAEGPVARSCIGSGATGRFYNVFDDDDRSADKGRRRIADVIE